MKYKFFGEPNMLVKTRKKVLFDNKIEFKPLFRFDEKGEFETEDIHLINKLKSRFDHKEILDIETEEKSEEKPIEKAVKRKKGV